MLSSLVAAAGPSVELAKAEVAVGDERAHPQLVPDSDGVVIVPFSGSGTIDDIPGRDFPEQTRDVCFVPSLSRFLRWDQRFARYGECLLRAAVEEPAG
jgi:hypothetical protein